MSIGDGSIIGLGKAMSVRSGLFHVVISTTYAGSEVAPVVGETVGGKETTRSDPKILPSLVIYDVDLTMALPINTSIRSGINLIAHAVEAELEPHHEPACARGHRSSGARTSRASSRKFISFCALRCSVRRMAVWNMPRQRWHASTSQTPSYTRWKLQPSPFRNTYRHSS